MVARTVKARAFKELRVPSFICGIETQQQRSPESGAIHCQLCNKRREKSLCLSCACDVLSAELLSFFPNPVSAGPVLSLPHFGAGPKSFPLLSLSTQLSPFLSCHICHNPSQPPSNSSSPHTQAPWQVDCTMLCFYQSVLVCIDVTDFSCGE